MTDEQFIKTRHSFAVAPYALYDVIHALLNDNENYTRLSVGKEDGSLVVFVAKEHKYRHNGANGNEVGEIPIDNQM